MEKWRKIFREWHSPFFEDEELRKKAVNIIAKFKRQNPKLMRLNPEIGIDCIIEDENRQPCNYFIICIGHLFIFDERLIPFSFEGIEVHSSLYGNYPKEFPSENAELPLEDWYAPERYQKYVKKNINLIRQILNSPKMTINEALDALTGDFNKHKNWAKKIRMERIEKHKGHIQFFNNLLKKTKNAYKNSNVYKQFKDEKWGYSVTATSFNKNKPVIVGFNWGVDTKWVKDGNSYGEQKDYPFSSFSGLYDELGSFKRVVSLFYEYLPEANSGVQTNFCFFRSQKERQISKEDRKLCVPLFEELINYLEPSKLITFSRSLNDFFENTKKLDVKKIEIFYKNKYIYASKGIISLGDRNIEYYNLPHPNYPISTEARLKAWDFCFKGIN